MNDHAGRFTRTQRTISVDVTGQLIAYRRAEWKIEVFSVVVDLLCETGRRRLTPEELRELGDTLAYTFHAEAERIRCACYRRAVLYAPRP